MAENFTTKTPRHEVKRIFKKSWSLGAFAVKDFSNRVKARQLFFIPVHPSSEKNKVDSSCFYLATWRLRARPFFSLYRITG